MNTNYINANGSVKISEDVIATIVAVTARESENISGLTARTMSDIKGMIPGKKASSRGVKVDITDGQIEIEVGIVVKFGSNLQETALKLQADVIKEIEAMTGMKVRGVDVYIQGIEKIVEKTELRTESKAESEHMA